MAHVPWLGQLFFRVPGMAKNLKKFRKNAEIRALNRKAKGSQYKDIYHHLVSRVDACALHFVLIQLHVHAHLSCSA